MPAIEDWLAGHEHEVDWRALFARLRAAEEWDHPWRRQLLDAMFIFCGLDVHEDTLMLDLLCGPGVLSAEFLGRYPKLSVVGLEADPLLLAMARNAHRIYQARFRAAARDPRDSAWTDKVVTGFDLVVSGMALHRFAAADLARIYSDVYGLLKPGGVFLCIDAMLSPSLVWAERMENASDEAGFAAPRETWSSFWASVRAQYGIGAELDELRQRNGPFEGSSDGYSRTVYVEALGEAGFADADVLWQAGPLALYGALKPMHEDV